MYNSQVQLICPVLIYATCAFFKSLIAVFLHQNPRTCGTISVNLDIGSTGARGGGIWLEAKPKAVYCQKCSVCCCWRFRQSLKVFSDLLKMFRTSCFCISFAWHGASGFLHQRLTAWVWTLALRVYKHCIWQDKASVSSHSLKKYRPWTFWRYVSMCCVYVCELCNKQATCCERFPHLLLYVAHNVTLKRSKKNSNLFMTAPSCVC